MATLAELIRQRREFLGLSQSDIARAVGVTPQAVSGWERSRSQYVRPRHLLALARVLDVSVENLVNGKGETEIALPVDERALLTAYRKLNIEEKKFLRRLVDGLGKRGKNHS